MKKIVTICSQGLCRSVAMADVLKLHFRPVDVIPIGRKGNTRETVDMMSAWADVIIIMEPHYRESVADQYQHKIMVCDVGPDVNTPQGSKTRWLIDKVWNWARENAAVLGIEEHGEHL